MNVRPATLGFLIAISTPISCHKVAAQPLRPAIGPGSTFSVPLGPTGVKVSGTPARAHVTWDPVAGASGYSVVRWKQNDPDCCRAESGTLPLVTSWDDLVQWSGTWVYTVKVHFPNGTVGDTTVNYVYPEPQFPTGFSARQTGPGTVVLSWNPVAGASYYLVGGPRINPAIQVQGTSLTINGVPSGLQQWQISTTYDPDGVHRAGSIFTFASTHVSIRGFADVHNHQFANLGFGGQAFVGAPYGPIAQALPHCNFVHGPGGTQDALGNVMRAAYGHSILGHLVGGAPEFDGWPRWDSLTHQCVYEDWLRRAHAGGLQLMVMLAVNNELFCGKANLAAQRTCDDSESVWHQIAGAKAMEAYIDEKAGGPGRGWYRIVRSPAEARRAIDSNQLAVVLGIEVDKPVCSGPEPCTLATMLDQIEALYDLGVRHIFPIHFQDNAVGGASFSKPLDGSLDGLDGPFDGVARGLQFVRPYQYRTVNCASSGYKFNYSRCNARGLTTHGKTIVKALMSRFMVIDVDHMSDLSFKDTLNITEPARYPVMSGHTGFVEISSGDKANEGNLTAERVERIRRSGGMVSIIPAQGSLDQIRTWNAGNGQTVVPHTCGNSAETVAQAYLYASTKMKGGPVGFGTDFNGMAGLPGPRRGNEACPGGKVPNWSEGNPLNYPFVAIANGTSMDKSIIGQKAFDINQDGLAHVGMLPDLVAEMQALGIKSAELEPLMQSAEGYISAWEVGSSSPHAPVENVACPRVRRALRDAIHWRNAFQTTYRAEQNNCVAPSSYHGQPGYHPHPCDPSVAVKMRELETAVGTLSQQRTRLACFI